MHMKFFSPLVNGKAASHTCSRQQTHSHFCWCRSEDLVHRVSRHCKKGPEINGRQKCSFQSAVCSTRNKNSSSTDGNTGSSRSSSSDDITTSDSGTINSDPILDDISRDGGGSSLHWQYAEDEQLPVSRGRSQPALRPAAQISSSFNDSSTSVKEPQQRQLLGNQYGRRQSPQTQQQVSADTVAKHGMRKAKHKTRPAHQQLHCDSSNTRSQQPQQQRSRVQSVAAGDRAASGIDEYWVMQERVRNLLVSANLAAPEATAEKLPENVNDVIIALHMLATAPKPKQRAPLQQYNAASAKLAAAILNKFKLLLLNQSRHQQQQQRQQQLQEHCEPRVEPCVQAYLPASQVKQQQQKQQGTVAPLPALLTLQTPAAVVGAAAAADGADLAQRQFVSSLTELPATRMAAAVFALGVLRQYDSQLVPALEAASGQLLSRSAFTANQLGQVAQGFTHLDHQPHPHWQQSFVTACHGHLSSMKGNQLASLAGFLVQLMCKGTGSGTRNLLWHLFSSRQSSQPSSSTADSQDAAAFVAAAAAAAGDWDRSGLVLQPAWVNALLEAVGSQAPYLDCKQLSLLLLAASVVYQQQQVQHFPRSGVTGGPGSRQDLPASLLCLPLPVKDVSLLPSPVEPGLIRSASHDRQRTSHDSSSAIVQSQSSQWLAKLLVSFQKQLPHMQMQQLAVALPALATLTTHPWPQHLLQPVLLQVQLLLPASNGHDIVAAAAGVAQLAAPAVEHEQGVRGVKLTAGATDASWSDALVLRLHAVLPSLSSSDIALVIVTLALLKVKPYKAWVYDLCARLRVETQSFSAGEIVAVIEGLAMLKIVLDPEVMHLFVLGIKRWMPVLGSRELDRLALGIRRMYPKVLPGRTVHQLVDELERRSYFLQLQRT